MYSMRCCYQRLDQRSARQSGHYQKTFLSGFAFFFILPSPSSSRPRPRPLILPGFPSALQVIYPLLQHRHPIFIPRCNFTAPSCVRYFSLPRMSMVLILYFSLFTCTPLSNIPFIYIYIYTRLNRCTHKYIGKRIFYIKP